MQLTILGGGGLSGITAVILAAGDSARMGYPKALLPFQNGTFLTCILETLSAAVLGPPLVILGRDSRRIKAAIFEDAARVLVNTDPGRGQISSMQLAISRLDAGTDACLFWPVDQPAVSASLVRELVSLFLGSDATIAMPSYNGKRGHPVIFHRRMFADLLAVPAGEGPKSVVAGRSSETVILDCDQPGTVEDVDTPDDYLALTGKSLKEALQKRRGPEEPAC